jgi:DNA-binding response OmpR family regulator
MKPTDNRATRWTFVLDEPTRILVVDDDPILREFASVYLATPSATIDTACDGAEARIRLGQNSYDVLLLDIEMPHLDGFSLLEEIRLDDKLRHLPVIMLTGHDDIASIDRAYQASANSFATKPVNWRQLSYQIRYVIRASRLEGLEANAPETGGADSEVHDVAPVSEREVRDFLLSILRQADAIEERLPANDPAHFGAVLHGVRLFAKRALAFVRRAPAGDSSCCVVAAATRDAGADYVTPTNTRLPDAMGS